MEAIAASFGSKRRISRAVFVTWAYRKDMTVNRCGGSVMQKTLLAKQKKGKAKMKLAREVQIPQEAFISVLAADTQCDCVNCYVRSTRN